METTKENVLFLLACAWLVLMHLAKHVTRRRNALCFRPFHQLNLLIRFLTSVLNLTYIFFSVLSLRQNSLLQSSLQLSYLHSRSFAACTSIDVNFCVPTKHGIHLMIPHFLTSI